MRKTKRDLPEDIQTLLSLVAAGRLFEVQARVQGGSPLRISGNDQEKFRPLFQAVEQGFHSMVAVLLEGTSGYRMTWIVLWSGPWRTSAWTLPICYWSEGLLPQQWTSAKSAERWTSI